MVYRVFHHLGLGAVPMPENLATSLHIIVLHTIALPTSKNSRRTSAEQKSPTQKPCPRFKPVFFDEDRSKDSSRNVYSSERFR